MKKTNFFRFDVRRFVFLLLATTALAGAAQAQSPTVLPRVNCVEYNEQTQRLRIFWGYNNTGPNAVTRSYGSQNRMSPGEEILPGQPFLFLPGIRDFVWDATIDAPPGSNASLSWFLSGVEARATNDPVLYCSPPITYQGRLTDGGAQANGRYDLRFELYETAAATTALASYTAEDVVVTNGIFTVNLIFPVQQIVGGRRHLQIAVRPGDSTGAFTSLAPRQFLSFAPYAYTADYLAGRPANQYFLNNGSDAVTSNNSGGTALNVVNNASSTNRWSIIATQAQFNGSGKNLSFTNASDGERMVLDSGGARIVGSVQSDSLNVTGNGTINGNLTVNGTLNAASLNNNFVQNTTTPQTANFNVSGNGTIGGNLTVNGTLNAASLNNNFVRNTTTQQTANFNVSGNGTIGGALSINGGSGGQLSVATTDWRPIVASGSNVTGTWFSLRNTSTGGADWNLISSGSGNGEGAGRLLFHNGTISSTRMILDNNGLNVTGSLTAASKNFTIDHPLDPTNKNLVHTSVESPDMKNIYDGNATTDASGEAIVHLPDYFEALNRDFRYQLTVIGTFARAIVAEEIKNNRFLIRTDQPNVKVSWQVTGIRKDRFAEDNRAPVEVRKTEPGKCLYAPACAVKQP
jgi:hypothetical protein